MRGTIFAVIAVNVNHIHSFLETVFIGFSSCFARVLCLPGLASILPRRNVNGPWHLQTSETVVISVGLFLLINSFHLVEDIVSLTYDLDVTCILLGSITSVEQGQNNLP